MGYKSIRITLIKFIKYNIAFSLRIMRDPLAPKNSLKTKGQYFNNIVKGQ